MWCLMVFNVIALIQSAQGGYQYPKPSIPFELPNQALHNTAGEISKENNIDPKTVTYSLPYDDYQFLQQHKNVENQHAIEDIDESVQQNFEIGIKQDQSHSLSTQLNANINVHSAVSQSSVIKEPNPISVHPLLSANCPQLILNIKNKVPPLINLQNSEYIQNAQEDSGVQILDIQNAGHILGANNNEPGLLNLNINQVSSIKEQPNDHYSDIQRLQPASLQNVINVIETIESPIINLEESVPHVLNPQNSVQTTGISGDLNFDGQISGIQDSQIFLPNLNDEQIQLLNTHSSQAAITREISSQNNHQFIASPVVTKSISFHVPPPDIEETPAIPAVLPRKKIYKIIFIKAPTYEYQYNQQLQSALYNKLAPIDDKTIIYVLTKKPEIPEQLVLPQPTKVSEHEVLYVQYKGDQTINSEQEVINENISQLPLNSVGDVDIEPRFLDGH